MQTGGWDFRRQFSAIRRAKAGPVRGPSPRGSSRSQNGRSASGVYDRLTAVPQSNILRYSDSQVPVPRNHKSTCQPWVDSEAGVLTWGFGQCVPGTPALSRADGIAACWDAKPRHLWCGNSKLENFMPMAT